MRKKLIIGVGLFFSIIFALAILLFSSAGLNYASNYFLDNDWHIETPKRFSVGFTAGSLPEISLYLQNPMPCRLLKLQNITLNWWLNKKLSAEKVIIDYACLERVINLPSDDDNESAFSLNELLESLPNINLTIQQLEWINTTTADSDSLKQLLEYKQFIALANQNGILKLNANTIYPTNNNEIKLLTLLAKFENNQVKGIIEYQPEPQQKHHLKLIADLHDDVTKIPPKVSLNYQWDRSDFFIAQGKINLNWQTDADYQTSGFFKFNDLTDLNQQIDINFELSDRAINIKQGKFSWDIDTQQPLSGIIDLELIPAKEKIMAPWELLLAKMRITLLSTGTYGKGALVINGKDGKFTADGLELNLQANGDFKYENLAVFGDFPVLISGAWENPILRFLPTSLLRIKKKLQSIQLDEIRFPMAGITFGRYGITGRLQTIIRGKTKDFSDIRLHLDGNAYEFIAGFSETFDIRDKMQLPWGAANNYWQWNFWGSTQINSLNAPLKIAGKGFWLDNNIEISSIKGDLGKIDKYGLLIKNGDLKLIEPILWNYENKELQGMLSLDTPNVNFNYGGALEKPDFKLTLRGKTLDDFNLSAQLVAGKLGPINLFARYDGDQLLGNIYWLEQSSKVFQSLFPKQWDWLIQSGTIRGQTAFKINSERGLTSRGYFAIRKGRISFPDGKIEDIEFALPFQYKDGRVELGLKRPVEVFIKQFTSGVELNDFSVKVQGYYPYDNQYPLKLTELKTGLLGGNLSVTRFVLPQTTAANLAFREIDINKLLQLFKYSEIEAKGSTNATLPFLLANEKCLICDGKLWLVDQLHLKLSNKLTDDLNKGGLTEVILVDLLSELEIQEVDAKINLQPSGKLLLNSKIKAVNPKKETRNPIELNYNHQENVYELWRSIDFGTKFEQGLEHLIYQKIQN